MCFKQVSGLDLTEDMARYVDRGEAINLPSDLFGSCTQIVDVQQPVFDRGFDLVATLKAHGRITGLEAGGPADSAGLREGDHIKIDELPSHDSRVTLSYRVVANDGTERLIRYRPIGKTTVTFQQIILAPNLTPLQRSACARVMGGTH